MLLELARDDIIPDSILNQALSVNAERTSNPPAQIAKCLALLDSLYEKRITAYDFSIQWSKLCPSRTQINSEADGYSEASEMETADPANAPEPIITNSAEMKLVLIKPGTFMMGSPADEPGRFDREKRHKVTLTAGFYLQTTPVTQRQWQAVMGKNPSRFTGCGPNGPVENVNWMDARSFIHKLNEMEGTKLYRLPTEAEWEYACRAGTTTTIYTGPLEILGERNAPALHPIAWYGGNSGVDYDGGEKSSGWREKQFEYKRAGTHPVGLKRPNAWGLYDMLGNVNEWCEDWGGEYPDGPVVNPTGPTKNRGDGRVFRGGSWYYAARGCRAAYRKYYRRDIPGGHVGLRLARSLP